MKGSLSPTLINIHDGKQLNGRRRKIYANESVMGFDCTSTVDPPWWGINN